MSSACVPPFSSASSSSAGDVPRVALPQADPTRAPPPSQLQQEVEIRPGFITKDDAGAFKCVPIRSKVVSLFAEHNDLAFAVPGGLIGVGTKIDPTMCRADRLVGHVLSDVGQGMDIYTELEVQCFMLRRLLGVRTEGKEKATKVAKLTKGASCAPSSSLPSG